MASKIKKIRARDTSGTIFSTSSSGLPKWRQSPIDLNSVNTWREKFPGLTLHGYWTNKGSALMTNTGKSVCIELMDRELPFMRGGPLRDDEFQLMNVEFRWGPSDARGAEHSVDNVWYSMEAQIQHWNTRYGTVEKCFNKPDGIAILSYFMQVYGGPEAEDNPIFATITDNLPDVKKMGSSRNIAPDCLLWMAEACSGPSFYTYPGSLTVPPYKECVIWIIVPKPISISARQPLGNLTIFGCHKNLELKEMSGGTKKIDRTVDLDDDTVYPKRYPPLILNGHWLNDGEAFLINSGSSVKVLLSGERMPSIISGGPLGNDQYEFYESHFHWSKENCRGAEHTINGAWYSMESHVVHWNRKYPSYEDALGRKDGISVLVYLFLAQAGSRDNCDPGIERITENLRLIAEAGAETKIPANSLSWIRLATHCPSYYAYQASYNDGRYPKCATWIVFPLIVPIRQSQVDEFRKLKGAKGEFLNPKCREIEKYGRRVFLAVPSEK